MSTRSGASFPPTRSFTPPTTTRRLALIGDADVAFMGTLLRTQLAAARCLRWIHSPAGGRRRHAVSGDGREPGRHDQLARHVGVETIAEHVLAVTLAMFSRLPHAFRSQAGARVGAGRDWRRRRQSRRSHGSRVLVVGIGAIGSAAAVLLRTSRRACDRHRRRPSADRCRRRRSRRASADRAAASSFPPRTSS